MKVASLVTSGALALVSLFFFWSAAVSANQIGQSVVEKPFELKAAATSSKSAPPEEVAAKVREPAPESSTKAREAAPSAPTGATEVATPTSSAAPTGALAVVPAPATSAPAVAAPPPTGVVAKPSAPAPVPAPAAPVVAAAPALAPAAKAVPAPAAPAPAPAPAGGVAAAAAPAPTPAPVPSPKPVVAAAPKPAAPPAPPKPAGPKLNDDAGALNLKADAPAEVYVDGKRVGKTPLIGFKLNAGSYKVRFDCTVDGAKVQGAVKPITVPPYAEVDVDHECASDKAP